MTHLNESLNSRQKRKKKSPEYNANPADLSLTFICYESMQNFSGFLEGNYLKSKLIYAECLLSGRTDSFELFDNL